MNSLVHEHAPVSTSASWLRVFANLLVAGYALDAGLSLLEELLRVGAGSSMILAVRNEIASGVLVAGLLAAPLLCLTPRLPLGLFLPLILSLIWLNTGAPPLPITIESEPGWMMTCVILQAAIAIASLLWIRRKNGGTGWLFRADAFEGPVFSLSHSLRMSLAAALLLPPLALLYGSLLLATEFEVMTHGFISFDLSGVSLADRRYVRGDREVRLVGMMHIGEPAAYREIVQSFSQEQTIVLEEGVSDENALLDVPLSYEGPASVLGLAQQDDLRTYLADDEGVLPEWPVLRNADLDMSELSPETAEWIRKFALLWSSDDPIGALSEVFPGDVSAEELASLQYDILDVRNHHLLRELEATLPNYERVIVPWGALHLPFIEESILERGFAESQRQLRPLISWRTVFAALL